MNAEELVELYKAGERDFRGIDLHRAELRGAELSGADLIGTNLEYADLRGAVLSLSDLSRDVTYFPAFLSVLSFETDLQH